MNLEELYTMNPWWYDRGNIEEDRNLRLFSTKKVKFYPSFLRELADFEAGVYVLRGPRQVGKTTSIKLLIKNILEKGANPEDILYLSAEAIKDRFELLETIRDFVQIRQRISKKEKLYIFLDEATFIKEWQLTVKYLVDTGIIDDSFVMVTGSSAYDLKLSAEKMPGRRGKGRDLVLLPATFRDFLKARYDFSLDYDLLNLLEMEEVDLKKINFQVARFKADLKIYMETGGFPEAINDFMDNRFIPDETLRIYTDLILGDIEKFSKSRTVLKGILNKLTDIVGQRISWNTFKDYVSEVESTRTLESYVEILAFSFIVGILYFYDYSRRTIRPKKQKKLYPLDPIFLKIIETMSTRSVDVGHRIETVVFENLLKYSYDFSEGLNLTAGPYFWYSDRGNEIDFLITLNNKLVPIEVKYQNRIAKSDYFSLQKVFGRGVLVTKDTIFRDGNVIGIPLEVFLSCR